MSQIHARRKSYRFKALTAIALTTVLSLTGLPAFASQDTGSSEGETVTITGTYRLAEATPEPGSTTIADHELHFIETADNELVQLHIEDEAELAEIQPGTELTVTGTETDGVTGDGLEVAEISAEEESEIDAAPTAGNLRTAVILLQKGPNGAKPITTADVKRIYFTNADSVREYLREASWSKLFLTGRDLNADGDVFDYLTIPADTACYEEVSAGNLAAANAGINLANYDMVSYVMDSRSAADCSYGGWAFVGGREHINLFYASITSSFPGIIRHEIGHNLGLRHANTLSCSKNGTTVSLPGAGVNCSATEYADPFDTMGPAGSGFHYSALNKSRIGWIASHKVTQVTQNGTYSLAPRTVNIGGSPQVLKVKLGEPLADYYIEYRQPYGTYWEAGQKAPSTLNGVQIRRVTPDNKTELIKANPSASGEAAYPLSAAQGTFTDPATGTKITVTAAGGPLAQVKIELPAAPFNKNFQQVYLRGTHNDWTTSTKMALVDNNKWEIKANFGSANNERFKFDINGDWSNNYGDNNRDKVADHFGADIPITEGAGEYTITWHDLNRQYTVVKTPVANKAPVPVTTPSGNFSVEAGVPVTFDGSASYDPDGTIVKYEWVLMGERFNGAKWTKTFESPGNFSVIFYVEDNNGERASKSFSVNVTQPQNKAPVAVTTPSGNFSVPAGQPVTFDGSASYDPDGTIVKYEWFLMGERFNTAKWTKTFESPGNFSVIFTVEDNKGATATKSFSVNVTQPQPYTKNNPQVYLRGTHNNWGTTTKMQLVGNHLWSTTVNFTGNTNERFKFDINGDWSHNYGDNNGDKIADYNAADIPITQGPGTYIITWNELSRAYTITKE